MKITKIRAKNFRLLTDSTLNLREELSLLIGKNNSGKTSLIVLIEKFLESGKFNIYDFPVSLRQSLLTIDAGTSLTNLSIQLYLQIQYDENDDLSELSELIPDIDESITTVNALFECSIDSASLLSELAKGPDKERYILKHLEKHLRTKFYVFEGEGISDVIDRSSLIEKDVKLIKALINLQIIHAKRNVSSSEEYRSGTKVLSALTTKFFNNNAGSSEQAFHDINKKMAEMDAELNETYGVVFEPFLRNAKDFLKLTDLKVVSDIQSNELIADSSQVVYGDAATALPEHLNGLGVMNILFLLLQIEMKKEKIAKDGKALNILIIEEPEAHTHPQMQYVFTTQIKKIIRDLAHLQTIITTHSSHIVSQCDFEDVRYLHKDGANNVVIKDFHDELSSKYVESEHFKFLVQYLTLQSSELFFADKIVFIEGTTEKILLPYFMRNFDKSLDPKKDVALAAQHISILEVGANARAFSPFLEFLGIKTLIITDLDSTTLKKVPNNNSKTGESISYPASAVAGSTHTSNYSLKHFYEAPEIEDPGFPHWYECLKAGTLAGASSTIRVAYQCEESGYQARSFEDAFIHSNLDNLRKYADHIGGLTKKSALNDTTLTAYQLSDAVIDKKSDFAASILYLGLAGHKGEEIQWRTPLYLKEALTWLAL